MTEHDWLAARFETDRPRLRAVAYRMLGSPAEADDAVQEAWLRVSRSDTAAVENMSGWLTTVVARVSLNMLQSRRSRREDLVDVPETGGSPRPDTPVDPEGEALLAESVGTAMLLILDTLTPAERLAFVLHDMFAVPFEEIAPIVDRTPAAARQLASRARRRIQRQSVAAAAPGAGPTGEPAPDGGADTDQAGKADLIRAFLTASREGDFEALLTLLAPDIVLRSDRTAVRMAAARGRQPVTELRGSDAVARAFAKLSWDPVPALVDGSAGLAFAPGGVPLAVYRFGIAGDRITGIDVQADLTGVDIVLR
ncbi:sigma-70 family RNA polymerase sigma factor [Streptomyces sp. NPDC058451]|uniref:sigma-70 family RNA polymerase sigma factor n=1 Tax=Streptomyces sp. NPDC058451 TaxID=3346506 RepID=UPI00364AE349